LDNRHVALLINQFSRPPIEAEKLTFKMCINVDGRKENLGKSQWRSISWEKLRRIERALACVCVSMKRMLSLTFAFVFEIFPQLAQLQLVMRRAGALTLEASRRSAFTATGITGKPRNVLFTMQTLSPRVPFKWNKLRQREREKSLIQKEPGKFFSVWIFRFNIQLGRVQTV
jgi:hypothetical protein